MSIHIIGSSGFIGKAINKKSSGNTKHLFYSSKFKNEMKVDINDKTTWQNLKIKKGDKLIFLSWQNLPNYGDDFHILENLHKSINFLKEIAKTDISTVVCAGTCFEYGLQSGCLEESLNTDPVNNYAIAKDTLRRVISNTFAKEKINLAWLRVFYPYGENQNQNSLIPLLDKAIKNKEKKFNISQGDQIRDFIRIEKVAEVFLKCAEADVNQIINVGSGNPVSIRDFLENYIKNKNSDIKLNLGFYPRRKDEPLAFWANTQKLSKL